MPRPYAEKRVVLDPGHGGNDPGAVTSSGSREAFFTHRLVDTLLPDVKDNITLGCYRTCYLQNGASLKDRFEFSNARNADVFLSIHANSGPPNVHGTWLIHDDNTDERGRQLAHFMRDSFQRFGYSVPVLTSDGTPYVSNRQLDVLSFTVAPALIIELDFITSEEGLRNLRQVHKYSTPIVKGLDHYFSWLTLEHEGRLAQEEEEEFRLTRKEWEELEKRVRSLELRS